VCVCVYVCTCIASLFIDGEKIYRTIASLLEDEDDTEFSSVMVQTLNLILLTARELFELRASLKTVATSKASRFVHNLLSVLCTVPVGFLYSLF
jgi:Vacuolar protein 14 C-terminal Fig4p binding